MYLEHSEYLVNVLKLKLLSFCDHRKRGLARRGLAVVCVCIYILFQIIKKVYLESYKGNISEPAGLRRLRKQVSEAKEGPLDLRSEKGKSNVPAWKKGAQERHRRAPQRESAASVFFLHDFIFTYLW